MGKWKIYFFKVILKGSIFVVVWAKDNRKKERENRNLLVDIIE